MKYQEAVEWLYSQLPNYQRDGNTALELKLDKVRKLAALFRNPQEELKAIHVAGTNGKGTVCHTLASVYQEAGYKVGLYTSPHLYSFTERIRVNGIPIGEQAVAEFVQAFRERTADLVPSFFEMTVVMAFRHFVDQQVDIAIIETGLGGRLDATNIITPQLSVITNVSYDHMDMLGNTLQAIAGEKAGIIKSGVPVIVGEDQPEARDIWVQKADALESELFFANDAQPLGVPEKNERTVRLVVETLANQFVVNADALERGIRDFKKNTGLRGRYDVLRESPRIIADVAHNEAGVKTLVERIQEERYQRLYFLWGMVKGKEHAKILGMLPKDASYFFVKPSNPRGAEADDLVSMARSLGLQGETVDSVETRVATFIQESQEDDLLVIGGSNFTIADIPEFYFH